MLFEFVSKNHVRVMYDSCTCLTNTYMPINALIHNVLSCKIHPHVRVWRLIL